MDTASNPAFPMYHARAVAERGIPHLGMPIAAIEKDIEEGPPFGLTLDLATTIIEIVCKKILDDLEAEYDERGRVNDLLNQTIKHLNLEPREGQATNRASARMIRGIRGVIQGASELRNLAGFASHGSAQPKPEVDLGQTLLVVGSVDAIAGFLWRAHASDSAVESVLMFDDNKDFNDHVDSEAGPVQIFDYEFNPSEVLFEMDQGAYVDLLGLFRGTVEDGERTAE